MENYFGVCKNLLLKIILTTLQSIVAYPLTASDDGFTLLVK